ncbi:MAG: flagellar basal body L-ring protein FlgH [Planctomycetes bacterium]|nr:flagellar basal body L-ring protein FlgH [Planctomycetota bacterium]
MKHVLASLALLALAAPALGQERPGSTYDPDRSPGSPISAKIAVHRGDIVTVLIAESQNVRNQEASDLSKATNLNYKVNLFDLKPEVFSQLPTVVDADSTDGFVGQAKYEKSGAFTARLAAIVVDTLPNGNLVVSGRREIKVDGETKLIEFSGIVRRYDITAANTVASELVANATVVYKGSGPLTDSTNRRGLGKWIHDLFSWLWPF